MGAPRNMTPEQRVERARKAATARLSIDHYIDKLVDAAPPLTDAQITRLRQLLPAVDQVTR